MTIQLSELFDLNLLDEMVDTGYVARRYHSSLPLCILNYTASAQYDRVWNDVTRQCRGLIYNTDTMEVVARPFKKFFNHGDPEAGQLELDTPVIVTDKADGSLAILFPTPDGYEIATRGSFESDQAIHATQIWKDRYADKFTPKKVRATTYLFEIVYPANKIVLDYQNMDDLILLGAINTDTGDFHPPADITDWTGPVVETFPYKTLAEALTMPPRENAEGIVVYFTDTNERLKIKLSEYVAMHKIVTGLNARTVWEHMLTGRDIDELIEPLPDEFHEWASNVYINIMDTMNTQHEEAVDAYANIERQLPDGYNRKEFAALASKHPLKWALFLLLDRRDIYPELLKRAKPEAFSHPMATLHTEDTA